MTISADKRRNFFIILMLGALSTISPFSIDMYLAAFPRIAGDLHTTPAKVSLSLSSYFIGLAAGQLLYGPLLDRFGRRRPLYTGMAIYIAACLACAATRGIDGLIFFRLLQALGGCAAQVAAVAMVRDFFHVKDSARVFALLMLVLGVSPLLAPSVGSLVVTAFGWPAVFLLLAALAALIIAAVYIWLPEGHKPDRSISLKPGPILKTFAEILCHPQFFTYSFAGAFSFAGLFVYVAGSSLIFMGVFHVSAGMYSAIFASLAAGFIGANQVNIWLGRRFGSAAILTGAILLQVAVALVFLLAILAGYCPLSLALLLFFLYLCGVGLGSPNASALALAPFARTAGSAAALLGFCQLGLGSVISAGVGLFNAGGLLPIVGLFAGSSVLALATLLLGRRRIVTPIETDAQEAAFVTH